MGNWVWWLLGAAAVGGAGYWIYTQNQAASPAAPPVPPAAPVNTSLLPPVANPVQQVNNALNQLQQGAPTGGTTAVQSVPGGSPYTLPPGSIPSMSRRAADSEANQAWDWRPE